MRGCDISHWNNEKQFNHIFKYADFIIHKATESISFIDSYCTKRINKCIKAGKRTGLYHFWQNTDPMKQLNNFNKIYSQFSQYSVAVLDIENPNTNWTAVQDFIMLFEHMYNKPLILYVDNTHYNLMPEILKKHPIWIARYNNHLKEDDIKKIYPYAVMWQYTTEGTFNNESFGKLDCDLFFGSDEEWNNLLRR